jgi:RHS repeat-associated protein
VLSVISDKKVGVTSDNATVDYYVAEVLSQTDYYPFGMAMPGRTLSLAKGYRFGFNGKENDNEVKGEGNQQDYGMRIYDPRLGRFLSVDPLMNSYSMLTPYQFASNRPIDGIDLDGGEYVTYLVIITNKSKVVIQIANYMNMTADQIKEIHGMSEKNFYYQYSRTFGPEGRGIKYLYSIQQEDGSFIEDEFWIMKQPNRGKKGGTKRRWAVNGIYSGSGGPLLLGSNPAYPHIGLNSKGIKEINPYTYDLPAIDYSDLISEVHDIYQNQIIDYAGWLEDTRTNHPEDFIGTDRWLHARAKEWAKLNQTFRTMDINGRLASDESVERAAEMQEFFAAVLFYKNWKVKKLKEMNVDPYAAENQDKVNFDQWKPRFLQFKQKFYKKILSSAREETN